MSSNSNGNGNDPDPTGVRIIVICGEGPARDSYIRALAALGAKADAVSWFTEFYNAMTDYAYNGIAVDLPTKIKNMRFEREFVHNILGRYPVAYLRFDKRSGKIASYYYGNAGRETGLRAFVENRCRPFPARRVRTVYQRKDVHLNVLLSPKPDFDKTETERTVTMNLSRTGCNIFTARQWGPNGDVWLVINELADSTPIRGIVRWKIDWGESLRVPGIGVEFVGMSEGQQKEISRMLE